MATAVQQRLERLLGYLEADPQNLQLLFSTTEAALDSGEPGRVADLIERYRAIAPPPAELENLAGIAAMSEGKFEAAATTFQALREAAPDDPALQFNLAWCRAMLGQWRHVADLLDEGTIGQGARAAALKVQALHHLGDLEDALAWGQGALERYPDDSMLHAALAYAAFDAGEMELAMRHAESAGATPKGHAVLGLLDLTHERFDSALQHFDLALAQTPNEARALLGKGLALLAQQDFQGASPVLDRAAETLAAHQSAWAAAAWARVALGDYAGGRERFEKALRIDDAFAEAEGGLAVLEVLDGHLESARRRIDKALSLDPEDVSAAMAKAVLAMRQGDSASAQRIHEAVMSLPAGTGGRTIAQSVLDFARRRR
ncbi:tetratricopeptide repeat protein [Mycolicibacterium sp.]|uniref:tetratricopeptide repeat protein n=1 Tax=Mycolicibacterium sp. TaxID=2320850 RepID=UPI00355ED3AA